MRKIFAAIPAGFFAAMLLTTAAFAQELAVGGQAVGIQAELGGVMIAGVSSVETADGTKTPAADAGLQEGDFIIKIDNQSIGGTADFIQALNDADGREMTFFVMRDGTEKQLELTAVRSLSGQWAAGVWLRDGVSGIGTLTFYDPETGIYGALGHCISVSENGVTDICSGEITDAEILSVTPGLEGTPGALNGCADVGAVLGSVERNSRFGIYGRANSRLGGAIFETGSIETGRAQMLATVEGHNTKAYDIEVNRVYSEPDGCHVMLTVTDAELCGITGGIVQGMSGSPIIQNGKLVGAVTHVFVSEPRKGYGISIDDMLSAAGIEINNAA